MAFSRLERKKIKLRDDVISARESGLDVRQIADKLSVSMTTVNKILFHSGNMATRRERFNEALVAMNPRGIRVISDWLDKGSLEAAKWLLENTGVVGKEQIKMTINAQNAQVNVMSNDTLEAARAVALAMKAASPKAFKAVGVTQSNNEEGCDGDELQCGSSDIFKGATVD